MRVVSRAEESADESEIQRAFEGNLTSIEEGLVYVASYVPVGTGIIDTLAVDDENNAVLIEFKKTGDFSSDALIQLMNYYAWFARDENHKAYLRDVVRKVKPELGEVEEIRLIAVVSNVDDDVKDACWALEPSVKIVSYTLFRDKSGELNLIPSVILDTDVGERRVRPPKTEEDHLKSHETFRPLYMSLKKQIQEKIDTNVRFNPAPQDYIGISRRRMFGAVRFKNAWIRIELLLRADEISNNPRYVDYPSGEWGYVHLKSESEIDEELLSWIKKAYEKAG
jgi:hypothetical protein